MKFTNELSGSLKDLITRLDGEYGKTYLSNYCVVKTKLSGTIGCLRRRQLRAMVRGHCTMFGLLLDLQEERGLFSSEMNIIVEGEYKRVSELMKKLNELVN